jgi:hypothetical protein
MIYKNMPTINQILRIPIIKKGMLGKLDARQSIFHAVITPPGDASKYDTHQQSQEHWISYIILLSNYKIFGGVNPYLMTIKKQV